MESESESKKSESGSESKRIRISFTLESMCFFSKMFQPRRQHNLGVYLLAAQLLSSDRIPPVTLGSILLQVAIFLGFIPGLGPKHTCKLNQLQL